MEGFETRKTEMYRLLEIYDGYEALLDFSESLSGYSCGCGYDEGILGKLSNIIDVIKNRARPALFDKSVDFSETDFARILDDRELDNRVKAEMLIGVRQ